MRAPDKHLDFEEIEIWCQNERGSLLGSDEWRKEVGKHLSECSSCAELVETHVMLHVQHVYKRSGTGCPDNQLWLELAAGILTGDRGDHLTEHAASCDPCAKALKNAIELFSSTESDEDLSALRSSTTSWQLDQAKRLAKINQGGRRAEDRGPSRFRIFSRSAPRLLASAATLLVAAGLGLWYLRSQDPNRLIAGAFDARRLTELRLPGTHPVPLYSRGRGARGAQEWPELLRAKLRVREKLEKAPESAYWHQALGKVFILQNDPKSALSEFQIANVRDHQLEGIQFDLGTAYFELGEESGNTANYGYAADAFSRQLDLNSGDTSALVNRALCWQKLGVKKLALQDLHKALTIERQPDWRDAIQKLIDQQNQVGQKHAPIGHGLRSDSQAGSSDYGQLDFDQYEDALESLLEDPRQAEDVQRVEELTKKGLRHNDRWLADWLAHDRKGPANEANRLLSYAARANSAGKVTTALESASKARILYSQDQNQAGEAIAEIEFIYALQRSGRGRDCLERSRSLILSRQITHYPQLGSWLQLEQGACLYATGSFTESSIAIKGAMIKAQRAHLPILYMRALGLLAGSFTQRGMAEFGWQSDIEGLHVCLQFPCPPMRQYQFFADLIDSSVALGLKRLSVEFASISADEAAATGNVQLEAYSQEVLGQRFLDLQNPKEAQNAFAQADAKLSLLNDNPTQRIYRADWAADRSRLLSLLGQRDQALSRLSSALSDVDSTQDLLIKVNYWSAKAAIEQENHQYGESIRSSTAAISIGLSAISSLREPTDRRAWQSSMKEAYITRVDSLIDEGKTEEAFNEWENFRSIAEADTTRSAHQGGTSYPQSRSWI